MGLNDSSKKTDEDLPTSVTLFINTDTKNGLRKTQPAFAEIIGKVYLSGVSEPYNMTICRVVENIKTLEKKLPNGNYFAYNLGMNIYTCREFANNSLLDFLKDSERIRKSITQNPYFAEFVKSTSKKNEPALVNCIIHVFNVEELKTVLKSIEDEVQKTLSQSKIVLQGLEQMLKF